MTKENPIKLAILPHLLFRADHSGYSGSQYNLDQALQKKEHKGNPGDIPPIFKLFCYLGNSIKKMRQYLMFHSYI